MSTKAGGSFATLLIAIPLSAIPLMAIFGIPQFAHVSASTEQEIPDIIRGPAIPTAQGTGGPRDPQADYRAAAADLLTHGGTTSGPTSDAPNWGESRSITPQPRTGQSTSIQRHPFRTATNEQQPAAVRQSPSPRPMQTAAVAPLSTPAADPPATASGLTWRDAARQLEDVGIHNYRLEPSLSGRGFLFVCLFSPGSDTRITQRFEAEASEPLDAVEDVLGQVKRWLEQRYAKSNTWTR